MSGQGYRLVIGNKNTSSWSLRPWLLMKHFGLPFEEVHVNLRAPDRREQILKHSPAGKVPVLWDGDLLIWDSLAIAEHLAERHVDKELWPGNATARSVARSVAAEMHSGFQALRQDCPMDFVASLPKAEHSETVTFNISRIVSVWQECRRRFGGDGPFLFSEFSIADAMYAPVASRFRTYVPDLSVYGDDGTAVRYIEALFSMPEMSEWGDGARAELGLS